LFQNCRTYAAYGDLIAMQSSNWHHYFPEGKLPIKTLAFRKKCKRCLALRVLPPYPLPPQQSLAEGGGELPNGSGGSLISSAEMKNHCRIESFNNF
jgi:hypothetical protein